MILPGVPVPDVITFEVMMVIGLFTPVLLVRPAAPCCRADMGIVLKIVVVPGLVVVGDMPLMPKIFPVPPA